MLIPMIALDELPQQENVAVYETVVKPADVGCLNPVSAETAIIEYQDGRYQIIVKFICSSLEERTILKKKI